MYMATIKAWLRFCGVIALMLCAGASGGCAWMSYLGTREGEPQRGKVFYIGGAGPVGNVVGTFDIPRGLRRAGYRGAIETFGWQAALGGTLRDQTDRDRNLSQAHRLAQRIRDYQDAYPDAPVDIIALSAGTGIATWALESLDGDRYHVQTVVYLASSLSRGYDLSAVLGRIDNRLYAFSSAEDPILRYMVPLTGSVDREFGEGTAAGLYGFTLPRNAGEDVRMIYQARLRNRPYKRRYARYDYYGLHTDATSESFVRHVLAPLLLRPLNHGEEEWSASAAAER